MEIPKSGGLVPLLILLPNILWLIFASISEAGSQVDVPLWLTLIENAGRLATLILPVFYALDLNRKFSIPVALLMGVFLILYYACWARYFINGRQAVLLKAPLFSIPLPMAVFPICIFLLSSYLMHSWGMLAAAALFGIAHLWVSAIGI